METKLRSVQARNCLPESMPSALFRGAAAVECAVPRCFNQCVDGWAQKIVEKRPQNRLKWTRHLLSHNTHTATHAGHYTANTPLNPQSNDVNRRKDT